MASSPIIPRKVYGFLSQSTKPLNLQIPWKNSTQDGNFAMNYTQVDAILTNLTAWAHTNWGERPMRFRFGLDARRYIFEPESLTKEGLISNAQDQLAKYFGYLEIKSIQVLTQEDDSNLLNNTVRFILDAEFQGTPLGIDEVIGN